MTRRIGGGGKSSGSGNTCAPTTGISLPRTGDSAERPRSPPRSVTFDRFRPFMLPEIDASGGAESPGEVLAPLLRAVAIRARRARRARHHRIPHKRLAPCLRALAPSRYAGARSERRRRVDRRQAPPPFFRAFAFPGPASNASAPHAATDARQKSAPPGLVDHHDVRRRQRRTDLGKDRRRRRSGGFASA